MTEIWPKIQQQLHQLFATDSLWLDAIVILLAAITLVIIFNMTIGHIARTRFNTYQKSAARFALKRIRFPLSVLILLLASGNIVSLLSLSEGQLNLVHDLFRSLDILIWGQYFYRSSQFTLKQLSSQNNQGSIIKPQTLPLLENVTAVVIILLIFYLLFVTWDIDMTAWLASAGIIGIAIGFAAKDTIANLLSGVFILADSPYKIGDYIVIDSGERGKVTNIGLRSTRILTRDDLEVNIPNAIIANGKIVNESAGRDIRSRIRVPVGVAYGSDIDQVKALLQEIAEQEPEACEEPSPRVRFRGFGASSLDLEVLLWISDPEIRGRVKDSMNTTIYKRFAQEGIEIPYSKHDLYIKSLPTMTTDKDDE